MRTINEKFNDFTFSGSALSAKISLLVIPKRFRGNLKEDIVGRPENNFFMRNKKIILASLIIGLSALALYLILRHYHAFAPLVEFLCNYLLSNKGPIGANKETNNEFRRKPNGEAPQAAAQKRRQRRKVFTKKETAKAVKRFKR